MWMGLMQAWLASVCMLPCPLGQYWVRVCVCARVPIRRNRNQRCTCRWLNLQKGGGVEEREPAIRSTFHHVVAVRSASKHADRQTSTMFRLTTGRIQHASKGYLGASLVGEIVEDLDCFVGARGEPPGYIVASTIIERAGYMQPSQDPSVWVCIVYSTYYSTRKRRK